MLQQLIQQIAPEVDVDKIQTTRDNPLWYKIIDNRLFVPPVTVLQKNVRELDKFVEAVKAFKSYNATDSQYNWTHLILREANTANELNQLHNILRGKVVACDIETKRVAWEDNKMLAIGFAFEDNWAYAVDWSKLDKDCLQILQDILNDETITFIWHNGKFDCTRLKYLAGIDARVDEDTMLQHYACINEKRGTHGLKDLGPLYLQAPQWDAELDGIKKEYCAKNGCKLSDFTYDLIPISILLQYMQRDCIATLRLNPVFKQLQMPGTDWIYKKLCEASNTYRDVELAGFQLDLDRLEDVEYFLESELQKAEEILNVAINREWNPQQYVIDTGAKSFPASFNLKSPKQLKWLLEKVVGHRLPNTAADTIEELTGNNVEHEELLGALKNVRKLNKQMDTYVCGLRDRVCRDHRIRGQFNLHGTETGRLSSNEPNMQNIPRKGPIKGLFVAAPGKTLLQLDYSQAELRVLAHLSKDEYMTQLYREDKDLHGTLAFEIFGPEWTGEQRNACKNIIFGSVYGRGPSSVAEQLGCTMTEARRLIERVFAFMPQAREWIFTRRNMASRGDDCISIFGRRRHFVLTSQEALNHIQNEYINTPVQSVASDLTMMSLMEISEKLKWLQLDGKVISTVHDSIILEVGPKDLNEIARMATTVMSTLPGEVIPSCVVPFKADAEYGPRWSELEKWEVTL